jgi:hypothetical protein
VVKCLPKKCEAEFNSPVSPSAPKTKINNLPAKTTPTEQAWWYKHIIPDIQEAEIVI